MIPVLACPVLNRADFLVRMIRSIDYPVENLVIINNGNDPGIVGLLYQLMIEGRIFKSYNFGFNLGVAASWNWVMKNYRESSYWLFIGNDMELAPGDLRKIDEFIKAHPHYATVPANWGHSLFAVTRTGLNSVGYFDENFYPAYCEDQDWMYRLKLAGLPWADCPDTKAIHGEPPLWGSSTVWSDPVLAKKCEVTQKNNHEYYRRKWGGNPGEETYEHPFGDKWNDYREWQIDMELAEANDNPIIKTKPSLA